MRETKHITILSRGKKIVLSIDSILYVLIVGKIIEVHIANGTFYETRMKMAEMEKTLQDGFIKIHRGCLVSVRAIHDITDRINLSNGESLFYALRKRSRIIEQFSAQQEAIIHSFDADDTPRTAEEYRNHYRGFDILPIAFTDIELVFDAEKRAVDWVFRYANPALARLEKQPLEKLIDSSFGSLFSNMESKWLRAYERAILYGETVEITDYSPEIDADLQIFCFPTFQGHCGCFLLDLSEIKFMPSSADAEKMLMRFLSK